MYTDATYSIESGPSSGEGAFFLPFMRGVRHVALLPTVSLTAYSSRPRRQDLGASILQAYRRLDKKLATKICIADPVDGFPRLQDRLYAAILSVSSCGAGQQHTRFLSSARVWRGGNEEKKQMEKIWPVWKREHTRRPTLWRTIQPEREPPGTWGEAHIIAQTSRPREPPPSSYGGG